MKMYVKMKELGPVGGACAGHAPPRSANEEGVISGRQAFLFLPIFAYFLTKLLFFREIPIFPIFGHFAFIFGIL